MQTHPIDLDELSFWGIVALRLPGELPDHDARYGKKTGCRRDCSCHRILLQNGKAARQE
jgi:hypothetical protein